VCYCAEAGICISGRIEIAASVGVHLGQGWLLGNVRGQKNKNKKALRIFSSMDFPLCAAASKM
jgi:hypothetical protein